MFGLWALEEGTRSSILLRFQEEPTCGQEIHRSIVTGKSDAICNQLFLKKEREPGSIAPATLDRHGPNPLIGTLLAAPSLPT